MLITSFCSLELEDSNAPRRGDMFPGAVTDRCKGICLRSSLIAALRGVFGAVEGNRENDGDLAGDGELALRGGLKRSSAPRNV